MIPKPIDKIESIDIEALISEEVQEGRTLDYKQKLPSKDAGEKTDFLIDIAAFANAAGGDLIFGIKEKIGPDGKRTGVPESSINDCGLEGINLDETVRRLDDIIQQGIDPRVNGVRMQIIKGFPKGPVIVVRVPKSLMSPHMVTFNKNSLFYSRNNGGNYRLSALEIRSAFTLSEGLIERIKQFRDERVARIIAGETPVKVSENPKRILHILPLLAFDPTSRNDFTTLAREKLIQELPECSQNEYMRWYWQSSYNFDGFLTYKAYWIPMDKREEYENKPIREYIQVFRNGALENVADIPLEGIGNSFRYLMDVSEQPEQQRALNSPNCEGELIDMVPKYLAAQQSLGLLPPTFIVVTLTGVKGYPMSYVQAFNIQSLSNNRIQWQAEQRLTNSINRDYVPLPEIMLEDYNIDAMTVLRPIFDMLWQTAGEPRCVHYYHDDGKWRPALNLPKLNK